MFNLKKVPNLLFKHHYKKSNHSRHPLVLKVILSPVYSSYRSHLLVVVMSEVQFVFGLCRLRLPRVDIIWIYGTGVCVMTAKQSRN